MYLEHCEILAVFLLHMNYDLCAELKGLVLQLGQRNLLCASKCVLHLCIMIGILFEVRLFSSPSISHTFQIHKSSMRCSSFSVLVDTKHHLKREQEPQTNRILTQM